MFPTGLNGLAGSNIKCLSYITVYGSKSKYRNDQLHDLEIRFTQCMSDFLKLNNPSLVDVAFIGDGSVTIFFLLPLQASLRLWDSWRKHPRRVQNAMRGLVYSPDYPDDRIPVLCVGSTLGVRELRLINEFRSEQEETATESSMLLFFFFFDNQATCFHTLSS